MTQIKPVTGTLRIIIYGAGAIGGVLGGLLDTFGHAGRYDRPSR